MEKIYLNSCKLEEMRSSLINNSPVIIFGRNRNERAGHAWVIDGYISRKQLIYRYSRCKEDDGSITVTKTASGCREQALLYQNWGWGGYCNGYLEAGYFDYEETIPDYLIGVKSIPDSEFETKIQCLYNIK